MYEFVLVIYMTMDKPEYAGHFESCAVAQLYVDECCSKAEYTSCLHEEYIHLPANFIKKEIDYGKR